MERGDVSQEADLPSKQDVSAELAAEEQRLGARIARLAELERKMHTRESVLKQREESVAELEKSLAERKRKVEARETRLEAREEALATLRRAADERDKRLREQELQAQEREARSMEAESVGGDHWKGQVGDKGGLDFEKDAKPILKPYQSPGCTTPSSGHPAWRQPQRTQDEQQSPWYDTPAKVSMEQAAPTTKAYEAISQALAAKLSGATPQNALNNPDAFITCQGDNFQELVQMALQAQRQSLPSEMDSGVASVQGRSSLLAEKAVRFRTQQQEEPSGFRMWQPRRSQVFRRLDMEDTPLKPMPQHWSWAPEARPNGLAGSGDHSSIAGTPRLLTPMQSNHSWWPDSESPQWRQDALCQP
mmetsp:Transcript_11043/g.20037  ORF Transcript_11043/g.20037 Transcript_11043/m.20037 type:complete len:362 (+) Transcript_11043:105-1190(+)